MQDQNQTGYRGKITNAASQNIQAPIKQPKGKTPKVQKGNDLRTGK